MNRQAFAPWGALLLCLVTNACGRSAAPSRLHDDPGVLLQASAANHFVKAYAASEVTARVRIDVKRLERTARPAANVALLVDTSGSMEGAPIADARAASAALLASLAPNDKIAVVVFNSKTEVLLPSTRVGDTDLAALGDTLAKMRAEGTTDMAGGLRAAIDEATRSFDPQGVNRVILLGDGVPNDEGPIAALAQLAATRHIAITTLGLGRDYNESLMGEVAQITGGRFHFISDSSKVAAFFRDEVTRVHDACARDATLTITPGPGVVVERVVGQEQVQVGPAVSVRLGDLSYGDRRDLIVILRATSHREGSTLELLDATLAYTPGAGGEALERTAFIGARATADDAEIAGGRDTDVEEEATRMKDAAKTVEQIKDQREMLQHAHDPVPSPSPGAAPREASEAPAPAVVMPAVQEPHDKAMDILQNY